MKEKYNPNNKEIAAEMLQEIGDGIIETGKNVFAAASLFSVGPYVCPTVRRIVREVANSGVKYQYDWTHHIGYPIGIVTGFALDYLQALGYIYAVKHDHPEVLAIPVVTNVVSALYEKARSTKKKLIEQHNAKTLEDVVEEKEN